MLGLERDKYFFSYSRRDAEFVLHLANQLKKGGIEIWLDQIDIPPSSRWDEAVEKALQEAGSIFVVLSPSSVKSQNVIDEMSHGLSLGKRIIPLMIEACQVPFRLARFQYIDFTKDYDTAFQKLTEIIGVNISPEKIITNRKKYRRIGIKTIALVFSVCISTLITIITIKHYRHSDSNKTLVINPNVFNKLDSANENISTTKNSIIDTPQHTKSTKKFEPSHTYYSFVGVQSENALIQIIKRKSKKLIYSKSSQNKIHITFSGKLREINSSQFIYDGGFIIVKNGKGNPCCTFPDLKLPRPFNLSNTEQQVLNKLNELINQKIESNSNVIVEGIINNCLNN